MRKSPSAPAVQISLRDKLLDSSSVHLEQVLDGSYKACTHHRLSHNLHVADFTWVTTVKLPSFDPMEIRVVAVIQAVSTFTMDYLGDCQLGQDKIVPKTYRTEHFWVPGTWTVPHSLSILMVHVQHSPTERAPLQWGGFSCCAQLLA